MASRPGSLPFFVCDQYNTSARSCKVPLQQGAHNTSVVHGCRNPGRARLMIVGSIAGLRAGRRHRLRMEAPLVTARSPTPEGPLAPNLNASPHRYQASGMTRAATASTINFRGKPTRTKSPIRYPPAPAIMTLTWYPKGVRKALEAPTATAMAAA